MKLRSRILALVLAVVLVLGMMPVTATAEGFARTVTWQEDLFTDVTQEDWFYDNVKGLYELGLMIGYGNGLFQPDSSISLAETLTVAARIHAISTYGEESFVQEEPWYQVYADYALKEGLIDAAPKDIGRQATRLEFAHILARTMPEEALAPINDVPNGSIPDLADDEAVYLLYRAGVLMGDDEAGTFRPNSDIKRSEVAAIVTRMILPELRHREDTPDTGTDETAPTESLPAETEPQPEVSVSVDIEVDENGAVKSQVAIDGTDAKATVPAGVAAQEGTQQLTLTVSEMEASTGNITLEGSETLSSYDVHIEGVSSDNQVPILVELGMALEPGFNMGNLSLYHVEDGVTNLMTQVTTLEEVDTHNEFYYDPATGVLTMAMATFSEIAVVADTTQPWEGNYDYSWYTGSDIAVYSDAATADYTIANADQLAAFSAIVGGMDSQTQDSFTGKTVKLIADINLNDAETSNKENLIFYPIGYYNSDGTYEKTNTAITSGFYTFEGTFDGNGHTIKNFYQNTWEMKGDHNWYDAALQYYRDGMGLFGKVYGGTVKNLTVENFSSDGEIATTGVIAAYADCGATFENIAIFNCNPRVYNIGNGGIVGCVGWYAKETTEQKVTFKNITVDNSNKISALWGSWDVACGGIVGQYYPTSGQSSAEYPANAGIHFENCHVAAQIDVNNDVCANYQYYAYRYAGMMIGSIRENLPADENGYVYPNMDGITASGCTVHFGDWNDYYYCELVANSLASYTHDHQFSRLEQVKSVDVENKKVTDLDGNTTDIPTSGRYNYVVVNETNEDGTFNHATENATCYHFVDGEIWGHADAGTETVDGVDGVLKEDKQHIYLEFNQLFTGYGWGVTSKGLTDFEGITNMDITEGDHEESVKKFESVALESYTTGTTVTIGDLFTAIADAGVDIQSENVQVTVSPVGDGSTAGGTYTANTTNWAQGTLTFSGLGAATITIQDYYFCTPTTITVNITEPESVDKFAVKFPNTDTYLYRVGNANTVSLGSLFKAKDSVEIGNVTVSIEALNDATVSGTYTANASDWTQGTIQFSGTGPVAVTISDDAYANEKTLYLEVVNATNTTTATSATGNNVVLLNDVSGGFSVSNNYTLYGNGFTVTLPTTVQSSYSAGYVGYVTISGGNLDNVRIVGPVYPEMYIYRDQAQDSTDTTKANYFYNSILINGGNCTISNSYISGSRTTLCIRGGNNVVIENTTLAGGAYANMHIAGASTVTLRDLTTVQVDMTDSYGLNKTAHGLGIAVDSNVVDIYIEGELNQYNWLCEEQWNSIVPSNYQSSFPDFFGNSKYNQYWHYLNGGTDPYVNMAFIYACNWDTDKIHDNRTTVDYSTCDSTIAGVNGGVYSKVNTSNNAITDTDLANPGYASPGFNPIAPVFDFDNTANADADDEADVADTYCVYDEDNGILKIGMTGDSKTLDLSGISVTKNGATLAHTTYLNGTEISGTSVTVNAADGTKQVLTFKVTSSDAGYDKDGNPIAGSIEYTWTVTLEIAVLAYPAPVWNMGGDYTFDTTNCCYAYYQTSQGYGEAVPIYEGIKVNYYNKSGTLVELDLSGTTTLPTGSANSNANAFTYTLSDGSTLTMAFVSGWKSGATTHQFTAYNSKVYVYPQSLDNDNYVRAKTTNQDFNVKINYTFTDPNGQSTETVTMNWYNAAASNGNVSTVQWATFDSTNGKEPECVTPDTLVTLADGTQKEVQYVTYDDEILVWDFVNGEYTAMPAIVLQNHGYGDYRVLTLNFSDGTSVDVIAEHGFFDIGCNEFVMISEDNVTEYVGHEFIKADGEFTTATLDSYSVAEEYTAAYSILTAVHYNCVLGDMLTLTPNVIGGNYFMPFEVGEDMKFDAVKMQADIEKYGLFTYEEFADYVTEEQFYALNAPQVKVAVGKGIITMEELYQIIATLIPQAETDA